MTTRKPKFTVVTCTGCGETYTTTTGPGAGPACNGGTLRPATPDEERARYGYADPTVGYADSIGAWYDRKREAIRRGELPASFDFGD